MIMMTRKIIDYKFYDTCSLLLKLESLFNEDEAPFAISSITLNELEEIKTDVRRDPDIKYAARKLLHLLDEHKGEYDIHIFTEDMLTPMIEKHLSITNDIKILATAFNYDNTIHPDETIFSYMDLYVAEKNGINATVINPPYYKDTTYTHENESFSSESNPNDNFVEIYKDVLKEKYEHYSYQCIKCGATK